MIIYDPNRGHEYLSRMFFDQLHAYANRYDKPFSTSIDGVKNDTVLINADLLTPEMIDRLKNGGNKIVGFSITDSSYISQVCRSGKQMEKVDMFFAVTGIQTTNHGQEIVFNKETNGITTEDRRFLPDEDWAVFDKMRATGRLHSLPYISWDRPPDVSPRPYNQRSQKALVRGGHHMRRFILCLFLHKAGKLDINSGFHTAPYFGPTMNPQFKYCEKCCNSFEWHHGQAVVREPVSECTFKDASYEDLGAWNNKCPAMFYRMAQTLGFDPYGIQYLLNARWISDHEYRDMLARISYTTDLKWLFSIYAAQRFWDAASAGCVNVLPSRTMDQEYFPILNCEEHYAFYRESSIISEDLSRDFELSDYWHNSISRNAREQYDEWIRPGEFATNTNLLRHIIDTIRKVT